METIDKILISVFMCFATLALSLYLLSGVKTFIALQNGYSEVQLQGTTSTMWVKGACK